MSLILSFALAAFLIELTPGPNMSYLAIATLKHGRHAGFATIAGVALGLSVVGIIAAAGLSTIVSNSPMLYDGLRYIGLLFFLYLAFEAWRDPAPGAEQQTGSGHFMRGLMSNLLNPKAATFYLAVLPRFIDPTGNVFSQTLTLTAIYVAIATAIHIVIVMLAGALRPYIDGKYERIARRTMAVLLVMVAVWFAMSTAR
jgi:threonine/homoserine/homoserine lactone efflux protein